MSTFLKVTFGIVSFSGPSVVDGVADRTMSDNFRDTNVILSCATDLVNSLASLCVVFVLLPVNMG